MEIPNKYELCFAGIIIAKNVSDKPDRKEQAMDRKNAASPQQGRFLKGGGGHAGRLCRGLRVIMLLVWDGILLYMIAECLISPVYGGAFVAVVSIYLGYQL